MTTRRTGYVQLRALTDLELIAAGDPTLDDFAVERLAIRWNRQATGPTATTGVVLPAGEVFERIRELRDQRRQRMARRRIPKRA